jgi:DNA-binding NarL/FixJ family response regulator
MGEQHPGINIIVLGNKLNPRYVTRILDYGARGFIFKQGSLEAILIPAIKIVRGGNLYLSPRAAALFYANRPIYREDGLNNSDLSVLKLIEQGYNPQEIAGQLELTPRSIYRIYGRLRQSLNVRTNEQIVDAARKKGLIDEIT